jgi:hypothetical protein
MALDVDEREGETGEPGSPLVIEDTSLPSPTNTLKGVTRNKVSLIH